MNNDRLTRELTAIDQEANNAAVVFAAVRGMGHADPACTVTVDAHGQLLDIDLSRASLALGPSAVSRIIKTAYRDACAAAESAPKQIVRALQDHPTVGGERHTAHGRSATQVVSDVDEVSFQRFDPIHNEWR